jgi:hypothetical protein
LRTGVRLLISVTCGFHKSYAVVFLSPFSLLGEGSGMRA